MKCTRKESQSLQSEKVALRDLGKKQIHKVSRVSLAVHAYEMKEGQIRDLFFNLFLEENFPGP